MCKALGSIPSLEKNNSNKKKTHLAIKELLHLINKQHRAKINKTKKI
jgi:hypothetical protein